jgi:molecular chaperone GrpE
MSKHTSQSKIKEEKTVPSPAAEGSEAMVPVVEPQGSGAEKPQEQEQPDPSKAFAVELEAARKEIATLKAEVAELNEKYLRKLADEVNFRKRMQREKDDALKYGLSSLLSDLIPILDDFDRGIASAEGSGNYEQLHEGVILIRGQLSQMLENKYALKRIDSKGQPFDPNRHEALFAEPADVEEAVVSEEYLPGYSLHDRVLRAAKVRVKVPAPKKAEPEQSPAEDAGQA